MRPRRLTSHRVERSRPPAENPVSGRARVARPAGAVPSSFHGPQDAIVSDTAVITPPVRKMPVFTLAVILLGAVGERQPRCIARQKTLAAGSRRRRTPVAAVWQRLSTSLLDVAMASPSITAGGLGGHSLVLEAGCGTAQLTNFLIDACKPRVIVGALSRRRGLGRFDRGG